MKLNMNLSKILRIKCECPEPVSSGPILDYYPEVIENGIGTANYNRRTGFVVKASDFIHDPDAHYYTTLALAVDLMGGWWISPGMTLSFLVHNDTEFTYGPDTPWFSTKQGKDGWIALQNNKLPDGNYAVFDRLAPGEARFITIVRREDASETLKAMCAVLMLSKVDR